MKKFLVKLTWQDKTLYAIVLAEGWDQALEIANNKFNEFFWKCEVLGFAEPMANDTIEMIHTRR